MDELTLSTKNTWCPGCGNFSLFEGIKRGLLKLEKRGNLRENFVLTTGVGCHAKIADYIKINTFYGLHGRAIPIAEGIKIGNPKLNVFCCSGDGDSYSQGMAHLIHAAKRNSNITVIIHDNHNFALTVKQFTATSPKGFKGTSTPFGNTEIPINPLKLMVASGATFVARGYSNKIDHLAKLVEQGIQHKGFSFIEILQPCVAWVNTFKEYNQRIYEMKGLTKDKAISLIEEWDYNNHKSNIPIGIFYQGNRDSFEGEKTSNIPKKKIDIKKLLKKNI